MLITAAVGAERLVPYCHACHMWLIAFNPQSSTRVGTVVILPGRGWKSCTPDEAALQLIQAWNPKSFLFPCKCSVLSLKSGSCSLGSGPAFSLRSPALCTGSKWELYSATEHFALAHPLPLPRKLFSLSLAVKNQLFKDWTHKPLLPE